MTLPRLLLASLLSASLALAQTAVWTGQGNLATITDWNDPTKWDTGAVPNGASYAAVINQATPAVRNFPDGPYVNANPSAPASVPGGALPVVTGAITLGRLAFDLPAASAPYTAAVYVGNPGTGSSGSLRLEGAGVDLHTTASSSTIAVDLNVAPGSSLTLANQARFTRSGPAPLALYLSDSNATPANPARLLVQDDASLDTGTPRWLTVHGRGAAGLVFQDRARAGSTDFQLGNQSTVEFHNTASADSASITIGRDSLLLFDGDTTAASSRLAFGVASLGSPAADSIIRFAGRSTAAQSVVSTTYAYRTGVEFTEQATGGTATVAARRLDISGAATAAGATGRQRAGSSVLAPTSVVATDARTISLKEVSVSDLLLGSNTLEVGGGFIGNIRDSGGAYLSAAGENLVGGGLVKTGSGTLTLYGPSYNPADPAHPSYNVITAPTVVREGTLFLYNRLADVTVEPGAIFTGSSGIVDGQLTNRGTVTGSAYSLRVTGNYVQASTGSLRLQGQYQYFDPSSLMALAVTGSASLAGNLSAALNPSALFSRLAPGTVTLPVLAAASITGRFDRVDPTSASSARLRLTAEYAPAAVNLRVELLPLATLGATPGARALGDYLDRSFRFDSRLFAQDYNQLVYTLTSVAEPEIVARILAALGPDTYGTVLNHGFATALARQAALDRLSGPGTAVFAEGGRRRLTYDAIDGLPEAGERTTTHLAGGRWTSGRWTVGGYIATEKADLVLDDTGGRATIDHTEPGAFARFNAGDWFVLATAGFSRDEYDLERTTGIVYNTSQVLAHRAAPRGQRTDWGLTAGRSWRGRGWAFTPYAGFAASRLRVDDFNDVPALPGFRTEMVIAGWSRRSQSARAGLRLEGPALGRLRLHLAAEGRREFSDDRSIPARFTGATDGYLAPGRPTDRNTVQVTGGLDVSLGRQARLSLDGRTLHGSHSRSSSDFTAGIRWEF